MGEGRATNSDHLHYPLTVIFQDCIAHFTETIGSNFHDLDKIQIHNPVYHSWEPISGSNAIFTVEAKYSSNNSNAFLRYSALFSDKDEMQCMMYFTVPCLLNLLIYLMVSLFFV